MSLMNSSVSPFLSLPGNPVGLYSEAFSLFHLGPREEFLKQDTGLWMHFTCRPKMTFVSYEYRSQDQSY